MQCKTEKATRVCDQCTFSGRKKPAWGGGKYHLCFVCFAVRKMTSLTLLPEPVCGCFLVSLVRIVGPLAHLRAAALSCRCFAFSPVLLVVVILRTVAVCQRSTSKLTTKRTSRSEGSLANSVHWFRSLLPGIARSNLHVTVYPASAEFLFIPHHPFFRQVLCKPKSFHHSLRNKQLFTKGLLVRFTPCSSPSRMSISWRLQMCLQERHADTPELTSHTFTPVQTPGSGELTCSLCDRPASRRFVGVSDAAGAP